VKKKTLLRHVRTMTLLQYGIIVMAIGLYQLGTSTGVLEKLYARNEFQVPSQTNTLTSSDVPIHIKFSLRTTAAKESNSSQVFIRYNCRKQCGDKKCKYVINKIKCNSKYHVTTSCRNK
ncbi:hypothetical protein NQ318_006641, partial [Aromia moschata]